MTTTLAYIRHVASAGELSVLHTSDLWSRSGRVKPTWEPYQGFSRRALGPSFLSADDAARDAHEKIARRDDKVYGGLIYQRLDNRFVATEPLACHNETFDPTCVIPPELIALTPHGCSVVAVYHTHRVHPLQLWRTAAEEQLFQTMLEPHELNAAIRDREWAPSRYFSARDGTLLKYTPSDSVSEHLLRKQIAAPVEHPEQVRKNAINMAMRANALKPSEYIRRVARAGSRDPRWAMPSAWLRQCRAKTARACRCEPTASAAFGLVPQGAAVPGHDRPRSPVPPSARTPTDPRRSGR